MKAKNEKCLARAYARARRALRPAQLNGETECPARCLCGEEQSELNNVFAGKPEKPVTRKEKMRYVSASAGGSNILLSSLFKSMYICVP